MTFGVSSQAALSYVKESSYGTTPGSPSMLALRATGWDLNLTKSSLISEERRTDGQIPFARHGMNQPGGSIDCEISYLALKDLIRAALRYDTTVGSATSTAGTDTAFTASPNKIVRTSGSFVTNGFVAGMKIRVTGSAHNDGVYTLSAVAALNMTVSESLTAEVATPNVKIQGNYAENGTTETSYTLEEWYADLADQSLRMDGVKIGGFAMNFPLDAIPTIRFDVMGQTYSRAATRLGTPSDVDTSEPCDTHNAAGSIEEGGTDIAILTALSINGTWNRSGTNVLGSQDRVSIEAGRLNVSGSATAYFEDETLLNKFINETASTLRMGVQDGAGNEFQVYLPNIKYMSGSKRVGGDDVFMLSFDFQALMDATLAKTLQINMIPATAA